MKILTPHPTSPPTLEGIRSDLKVHPEQYNAQFDMFFFHNNDDKELTEFGHTLTELGTYLKVSEFKIVVGKESIHVTCDSGRWIEVGTTLGDWTEDEKPKKKYGWVSQQAFDSGVNGVLYKTPDGDTVEIFKYTDSPDNQGGAIWPDAVCIGEITQFVSVVRRGGIRLVSMI